MHLKRRGLSAARNSALAVTAGEVIAFLADKDPAKRDKLVDRLVESTDYAFFFANKWADILRVKRRNQPDRAYGTFAFHTWIREAVAVDKPYDEFVRELLTAVRTLDSGQETLRDAGGPVTRIQMGPKWMVPPIVAVCSSRRIHSTLSSTTPIVPRS